jgi:hypothetical protein
VQHWEKGGHDQLCKKIKKTGGAEQYNANKRYSEAVAVAVEKCADDTKGQTCFICTQALHWKTKEGLVRGCSCRGTAGFVHVSCLAEQAKILCDEGEEKNLGEKAMQERFDRWNTCSLCEQEYHGAVLCALSWACWKTYVGRPEADGFRISAMSELGNGLHEAKHHDALSVREAELSMRQRLGDPAQNIIAVQGNLASTYQMLGRLEPAARMRQEVYSRKLEFYGAEHYSTLLAAYNYASTCSRLHRYKETKTLMLRTIPVARRTLGDSNDVTLRMRSIYANALYEDSGATLDDIRCAVTTLEETGRIARRVLGGRHPTTETIERDLRNARADLCARETQSSEADDLAARLRGL